MLFKMQPKYPSFPRVSPRSQSVKKLLVFAADDYTWVAWVEEHCDFGVAYSNTEYISCFLIATCLLVCLTLIFVSLYKILTFLKQHNWACNLKLAVKY